VSGTQTKASPSDIRISNITAAFKQLFPATQISRANIGKLIGLSRFTTSEVTGEMVDNRILRELGPDNREGRGKRSQVLAIDTDFWRIVSIDLSNPKLAKGALADLSGRIVDRTELPADNGCSVDDVISLCKQLIASTPLPILGIGIAVTGIVEPDGVVRKSVHLEWNELPLKAEVENATGVPTLVGNDTNAALVAERFFGDCSPIPCSSPSAEASVPHYASTTSSSKEAPPRPAKSRMWWSTQMDRPANAANEAALNRWFPTTDCKNASRRIPPHVRVFSPKRALCSVASWPYRPDCWICVTFRYTGRRKSSMLNSSTQWKMKSGAP